MEPVYLRRCILWNAVMSSTPGTVSKILWHFTGGPLWDSQLNKQSTVLKSKEDACKAMMRILLSKSLHLGQYREVVTVCVKNKKVFNRKTRQTETFFNVPTTLQSSPICCLADIPIQHLNYHAERYGNVAIGFHRAAAIRAGFSPVLYQVHNWSVLQDIYDGFSELEDVDTNSLESSASELTDEVDALECSEGHAVDTSGLSAIYEMEGYASAASEAILSAKSSFQTLLAFIKTFEMNEFGTIYCEREWRSTKQFDFAYDDVSMIVVPRNYEQGDHYERFVEEARAKGVPPTVSVVAWDDLVEH
jgi:hypothetical protein